MEKKGTMSRWSEKRRNPVQEYKRDGGGGVGGRLE